MEGSVVYFLLVNVLTIVIAMGNEGSNVHRQTKLSKMNRGEVEEVQENFNNDRDREVNISIRENTGAESVRESNAKHGVVQRRNRACYCNRHSQRCRFNMELYILSGNRSVGECLNCKHNTAGRNCHYCKEGFYRDHTKPITHKKACIACNSNLHARSCRFSKELYILSGFQSGGVCLRCKRGTAGRYRHYCKEGFFRDPVKPLTHRKTCKAASVSCQFEDSNQCGYINHQPGAKWDQRSGHFFKIPQYDHTYGNSTGKFMVAYNSTDLLVYYNTITNNGLDYPSRLEYLSAILTSPRKHFTTESCIYFYYYLNGTAVRPTPLSAQLLVYVHGSSGKRLAWYDHVNRTVNDWLKGWVSVESGDASIVFEGKTVTTTTIWPGLVALDDVSVISEPCPAYPDCGPDTFQCTTSRVCIPVDMQCDGGNDCMDGSDEDNCNTNTDCQVKLMNGDGSYGSIAMFYQGLWRPVCMNKNSFMKSNSNIVELVCNQLSYRGRFQSAFVNSWHQPVQHAMEVTCSRNAEDLSRCSIKLTKTKESTSSCYYYQAALCSHDECFSGEKLCPKDLRNTNNTSSTKCISTRYFCDGIPDCRGGTDEFNCANCSTSEFECTNHDCVPASQRCDGIPQCGDKSDEYGCVIVADSVAKIYHSQLSTYLPVCYNNMHEILADMLCSLSGQGAASDYISFTDGYGTILTPQSDSFTSIVPGFHLSHGLCKSALINCTSFECGTTILDDSRLQKIIHGRDAVLGQLPWQVAIYRYRRYSCGGFIIHPNWILTAAHCIKNVSYTYTVRVGAIEVEQSIPDGNQNYLYAVLRSYIHPSYNKIYDNDIALLYLNPPIVFNDYVRPICIASRTTAEEIVNAGHNAECYVSGWGLDHNFVNKDVWLGKLQVVRVYLYPKDECDQIYLNKYGFSPQSITVCMDNQNHGSPPCHGDSGGALICRNNYGRFEVLGSLSLGYKSCFEDGYPDIYQLSHAHESWIEAITGLDFSDLTMDND